jgi:hypothetical protein
MVKYAISGSRKRAPTAVAKKKGQDSTKISIKAKKVVIKKEKAPKKERKKV